MPFARRQRLAHAMQKLQTAHRSDGINRIARECGYRSVASVSTHVGRALGVNPSMLLRACRGRRNQG